MNEYAQGQERLLIVDDDSDLRKALAKFFEGQGLRVTCAANAGEARQALSRNVFDAIVLDGMMPGEDGFALLRSLRAGGEMVPVVMLTAKTDEIDRIIGLESGADDYCPKPFSPRELLARLKAIWRRGTASPSLATPGQTLPLGSWIIDLGTRSISKGDKTVALSEAEFSILKAFAKNPGIVLSRDRLMSLCGGGERDAFDRSIDVRVARARKIVEDDPASPKLIQTARGSGYAYIPPAKQAG